MKKKFFSIIIICCILFVNSLALAEVIFSNYGPGDTHSTTNGRAVLYNAPEPHPTNVDWDCGVGFTPAGTNYYLDTIELTAAFVTGTDELDVWLMNDNDGIPGSIIEAFHFRNELDTGWTHRPPLISTSFLNPILQADIPYWLIASTPVEGSFVNWFNNPIGLSGPRSYWYDDHWAVGTTDVTSVFRITGTPIPEPTTLLLFALGGLVIRKRK